jgi:exodeoxyribonuclease VIII
MVDLETVDNGPMSAIVAIGAVEFDETGIGEMFYTPVNGKSCVDMGMTIGYDTVMWWLKQSDDARKAISNGGVGIQTALVMFSNFVTNGNVKDVRVWGNGATFDNVILNSAYKLAGIERPWSYRGDRCYRTMKDMYPFIKAVDTGGTAHNALDDAKYQALHMSKILAHLKGE